MAARRIPNQRPTHRKVSVRALSYALAGPEQPYPVYQFSQGRTKVELPRHNPFKNNGA